MLGKSKRLGKKSLRLFRALPGAVLEPQGRGETHTVH